MPMLAILAALLALPLPPVGMQVILGDGVLSLTWTQQSDANVVCISQAYQGIAVSHGCTESIAGPRSVTLPDTPAGTHFYIHEWHRAADGGWRSYGLYGPIIVPYRIALPIVTQ